MAQAEAEPHTEMDPEDAAHPDNKALKHEGWSDIREQRRHCTDCLCVLLLLAAWIAMTVVGFLATGILESSAIKVGNPYRLTNAIDYYGHICGYSSEVIDQPYGYYLAGGLTSACVSSCPSSTNISQFICVSGNITSQANTDLNAAYSYTVDGECMYTIKTKNFLNRCFPDDPNVNNIAQEFVNNAVNHSITGNYAYEFGLMSEDWFYKFALDIYHLRGYVFGFGIGVATGLAFLYTYLLRIPGVLFIVTWSCLIGILALLCAGSFLLWSLSRQWTHDGIHSNYEVIAMQVFSYVGMACILLYFALLVVMRSRIQLSIHIIKEAARAIAAIPLIILMPVYQVIGVVAFLVPWYFHVFFFLLNCLRFIYVIFLASSGDLVIVHVGNLTYRKFQYDNTTQYTFLYMLFCWFWTSQFIVAFGQMVIALAVVAWYFNRDKSKVGNGTLIWVNLLDIRFWS